MTSVSATDLPARPLEGASIAEAARIALICGWSAAVGLRLLRVEGPDEAFFTEAAHLWTRGALPYVSAFDVKPPGYFALLAVAQSLFGASIETIHGLSLVFTCMAAVSAYCIGRRLGRPGVGLFAALAYPVLSQFLSGDDAYPPLEALSALAFLAALSSAPAPRRALSSGFLIGAAFTIKQTAAFEALAIFALLAMEQRGRWPLPVAFVAAAAAPALAFVAYFAAHGALAPLIADVLVASARRSAMDAGGAMTDLLRFVSLQTKVAPLFLMAAACLPARRGLFPGATPAQTDAIALWYALTLAALVFQHSRWLGYLGPSFIPSLLLAGAWAARLNLGAPVALRLALIAAALFATVFPYRSEPFLSPLDERAVAEAAAVVRERAPRPQDRLLSLDVEPWINSAADVPPPNAFFYRMHLYCDFPGAGPDKLREALATAPRFIVAAEPHPGGLACERPGVWPEAQAVLAQNYVRVGPANLHAPYAVYERRAR